MERSIPPTDTLTTADARQERVVQVAEETVLTPLAERVIYGQRLLQAVGDPLLGWTMIEGRPFYVRQMKNMKGEIPISRMTGQSLLYFSHAYGALLAKAHARTGDAAAIAGYCGHVGRADLRDALADWSAAYGDRTAADYETFLEAVASGRLKAADDPHL